LTQWQSKLLDKYAPYTVLNCRKICRQAFTEAVKFGLIPANPFDLGEAPRAKRVKASRALSPADAKAGHRPSNTAARAAQLLDPTI